MKSPATPSGLLGAPPELLTITLGNSPRGTPSSTKTSGISPGRKAGDLMLLYCPKVHIGAAPADTEELPEYFRSTY